jgi:deferrochelatase/peroxidase EfeB
LADALTLKGDARELAGALVVGRFEDGTSVTMSDEAKGLVPPNDFNYAADAAGSRCPFHAHIRKTNPRTSSDPNLPERAHIMARRGITYEEPGKSRKTKASGAGIEFTDQPTRGVGLLFIAYQQDIAAQFEFTQQRWINDTHFVAKGTGLDPLVGQGKKSAQRWPVEWGSAKRKAFSFAGFVTLKGGEYFFAPPISFLKSLAGE